MQQQTWPAALFGSMQHAPPSMFSQSCVPHVHRGGVGAGVGEGVGEGVGAGVGADVGLGVGAGVGGTVRRGTHTSSEAP